jgi:hypothetical protein
MISLSPKTNRILSWKRKLQFTGENYYSKVLNLISILKSNTQIVILFIYKILEINSYKSQIHMINLFSLITLVLRDPAIEGMVTLLKEMRQIH